MHNTASLANVASARTLSQPGTALLGTGLETRRRSRVVR